MWKISKCVVIASVNLLFSSEDERMRGVSKDGQREQEKGILYLSMF